METTPRTGTLTLPFPRAAAEISPPRMHAIVMDP